MDFKAAMRNVQDGVKTIFGYRALERNDTRRPLSSSIKTADELLKGKRAQAINATAELEQNFALAAWAVRTHLNFVSSFNFQARTPDDSFNRQLESFIYEKSRKGSWDICRRLSLNQMFRAWNALKVWQGDAAILKILGGRGQLVESWQIAKGDGAPDYVNENGLVLDPYTAVLEYAICGKSNGSLKHQSLVGFNDIVFDGFFSHAAQTRGHSPWNSSLNSARDLLDATEFYLLKSKLSSLFGLVLYRDHSAKGRNDFDHTESTDENDYIQYSLNGAGIKLELDRQDKAEFIESKSPSAEFQEFAKTITRQILSSLDIPYSAYDSEGASYAGMRADWNRYKTACLAERDKNSDALDELREHQIVSGILSGELQPPRGWTMKEILWENVPTATFILDQSQELAAYLSAIAAGITTRQDVCTELGKGDFRDIAQRLAKEQALLTSLGVTVTIGQPGATTNKPT